MVQRVPELGFLPPSQRRHFLDLSPPSHDSSDTMSLAKHPKNSTAQHGFGFELKLAKNWRHEIETCPKGQENSRAGESVAQVSVLCWREADRHQTPLLSLCMAPLKHQTGAIPPRPPRSDCHLRCYITQLANSRLHIRLAQLRPISGTEHMAQNPPWVSTGAAASIQLVWNSLKCLEPS